MTDKPEPQRIDVPGMDTHGAMGEAPPAQPKNAIPDFILKEGQRQAAGGAHFYGVKLTDCTREELYAAVVAAWYEARKAQEALAQAQSNA